MTQVAVRNQIWNYTEVGEGNGTPILILHGWGRSGNEWNQMARELSAWSGRKAYVVDLPGFGGSSLPTIKNIFEYSQLVVKFCEYMGLDKVVLIGHSLGGRVGIIMGADCPEIVERVILIDPAGVKPRSIKRVCLNLVAKMFVWVPYPIRTKIIGWVMDEDYRNTPTLRNLYRAVVGEDLRTYLPKIKGKTWVIWGEKDKILPLSLLDIYKKLLVHPVTRVIWGAGHDPHLSHYLVLKRVLEEAV
ncbi:MAG: alpha/beta hydrolase [Microgenomates group bacterium]